MSALDYQLDFNGTVIGDGTPWEVIDWGGLEQFTTRGSDITVPTGWGTLPGSSFVDPRVVTITIDSVNPVDVLLIEAAFTPPPVAAPDTLVPIRWKFPNREELRVLGRCSRRVRARDRAAVLGLTQVVIELEIPDPRAYAASPTVWTLPVYVAGAAGWDATAGSGVDAGWDATAGSGVDAGWDATAGAAGIGLANVLNAGNVDTYPVLTFQPGTGISAFSVTNQTTGQVISFTQSVPTGSTLIADMQAAATASSNLPISINGTSVYGAWTPPRTPFRLVPGINTLRFDVAVGDPNATCAGTHQSAYL